ncbi:hypothetical protein NUW58_g5231 [Xylaria curta]|uniref:Uncharacterized protein n=1 Tax=Xylaria curta TaxID=42375 RepID=A0ACC1P2L3_9PEZI|nr:hypothetical protein NUW58_g5231 [Xylaria curta]
MLVFASIRFYVKVIVRRKVTADDWTTLAAVVSPAFFNIGTLWYYAICIHAVTRAKFGTHMWDMSVAHTLSDDFLIIEAGFLVNWPSGIVWAFAKTSFFLMYLQVFGPLLWLRVAVYVGLVINWLFYTIVTISGFVYQVPNPGQTWQQGFMNQRYSQSFKWAIPVASGSLILDVYILVLPIIAILNLQLNTKKKLGFIAVFATGHVPPPPSAYISNAFSSTVMTITLSGYIRCMPSNAGILKSRGINWQSLKDFAFSSLRCLPGSRKCGGGTGDGSNSRREIGFHSKLTGENRYVHIQGEESSSHELTNHSNCQDYKAYRHATSMSV